MSKYHVCDICEAKITKERHWWKEYYRSLKVEHLYPSFSGEHLKDDIEICPDCWNKFVKYVQGDQVERSKSRDKVRAKAKPKSKLA